MLFYLVHTYEKGLGGKPMLSALTHLSAQRRGTGRGVRILHLTLSFFRDRRDAEAAVTHLVVSSSACHYDGSARLKEVHVLR